MSNILIVDDNLTNRLIIKHILDDYTEENPRTTFTTYEAKNGLEAVDIFKKERIDLVFMDIMMDEMDGIEATKEIIKINSTANVIGVSAVSDLHQEIIKAGAKACYKKPVDIHTLRNHLNYLN